MEKPSYLGHRARIKNKFKNEGLKPFLDHEVLELLLTYSIPRKDTKKLAWNLLKTFGSLSGVLDAKTKDLEKIKGLGPQSSALITVIRELATRYGHNVKSRKQIISNSAELYDYCVKHIINKKKNLFEVLFLDVKLHLIGTEILAEGKVEKATFYIRQILELVIKHGAKYIICIQNYPVRKPNPKKEDRIMTHKLQNVLEILSFKFADHIIIGSDSIYSLGNDTYYSLDNN